MHRSEKCRPGRRVRISSGGMPVSSERAVAPQPINRRTGELNNTGVKQDAVYSSRSTRRPVVLRPGDMTRAYQVLPGNLSAEVFLMGASGFAGWAFGWTLLLVCFFGFGINACVYGEHQVPQNDSRHLAIHCPLASAHKPRIPKVSDVMDAPIWQQSRSGSQRTPMSVLICLLVTVVVRFGQLFTFHDLPPVGIGLINCRIPEFCISVQVLLTDALLLLFGVEGQTVFGQIVAQNQIDASKCILFLQGSRLISPPHCEQNDIVYDLTPLPSLDRQFQKFLIIG